MKKLLVVLLLLITSAVIYSQAPETSYESGSEAGEKVVKSNEKPRSILYGFWDYVSPDIFPHVNTVKIDIDDVRDVPDGVQIIPYIGNFKPDGNWEKRMRNKLSRLKDVDPKRIPFIILLDEPISKGWKRPEMEAIIDFAKETDDRFSYTFSFTRTHTERRRNSEYPRNLDVAIINYYPFYREEITGRTYANIQTEEQFYEDFQSVIEAGRRKAPDIKWVITGQAFYNDKWRQPPDEAPIWYVDFISENEDIIGLTWFTWEWRGSIEEGSAKEMPAFLENVEKGFKRIPGQ
ncbi:hypothetical protein [Rhodohalobacter sp. 614A]|uniref:hypothetical protein n=1 Tax=Rhodohalobacter sp. 614A TaxID=2908649 RepID=UPI001F395965|nr:hypothetical protein [Rhodohalobacter sp. 614A]